MKKITLLTAISFSILFTKLYAQVGIGTSTPNAAAILHVDAGTSLTKGLLITGFDDANATVPNLGAGSRLMFYPGKGAFRAGRVNGTQWDAGFVGFSSVAMGFNSIAIGFVSTAMGYLTTASGIASTAMGSSNTSSGDYSTAMGNQTTASGYSSTAMGYQTTASGNYSTAMGSNTIASGIFSTAMGYSVSTNNKTGAFIIGDSDPLSQGRTYSGTPDQFVARFNNGYYLLTSGNTNPVGVTLDHNGNSWVSICDKNRKENFEPLNGEAVLQKLSSINFTSWNYKIQDPKSYRHYGIMAQDFNTVFGKDKYGVIGNDTTVNPIDMIGIDMAAIQALVKRTDELKNKDEAINKKMTEVTELKNENEKLKSQLADQNKEIENLHKSFAQLQTSFIEQQKLVAQSLQKMEALTIKQTIKESIAVK